MSRGNENEEVESLGNSVISVKSYENDENEENVKSGEEEVNFESEEEEVNFESEEEEENDESGEEDEDKRILVAVPFALPGNYTFEAVIDGKRIQVAVPPGGCQEGDVLEFPSSAMICESTLSESENTAQKSKKIMGRWNNGLLSCFDVCCSSLFWMTLFFPYIVLGQLMQRIKLNICGVRNNRNRKVTCAGVVFFVLLMHLAVPSSLVYLYYVTQNDLFYSLSIAFVCYSTIVLLYWNTRLRAEYRTRFNISSNSSSCGGCEDFCIALWCHYCSLIQISRQFPDRIHKKSHREYYLCSATGLRKNAPDIV